MIRAGRRALLSSPVVAPQPLGAGPGSSGALPRSQYRNILQLCVRSTELFNKAILLLFSMKAPLLCQDDQNSDSLCAGVSLGGSSWSFQPVVAASLQGL